MILLTGSTRVGQVSSWLHWLTCRRHYMVGSLKNLARVQPELWNLGNEMSQASFLFRRMCKKPSKPSKPTEPHGTGRFSLVWFSILSGSLSVLVVPKNRRGLFSFTVETEPTESFSADKQSPGYFSHTDMWELYRTSQQIPNYISFQLISLSLLSTEPSKIFCSLNRNPSIGFRGYVPKLYMFLMLLYVSNANTYINI